MFLITDDAPQYADAECLSKIINLGKPVIIILNVKAAISDSGSLKLTLRDIEKKFENNHVDNVIKQFRCFASKFAQNWDNIPTVAVHLKAAYTSLNVNNKENSKILYSASRIECLEDIIMDSVKGKGKFYRIKTFIDSVANPMLLAMELLLKQSSDSCSQAKIILEKKEN